MYVIRTHIFKFWKLPQTKEFLDFVLQKTWVDIAVAACLDIYRDVLGPTLLEDYPRTKALLQTVTSLPPIAAWMNERPPWRKFEDPEGLF